MKLLDIPIDMVVNINDVHYKQIVTEDFKEDDKVLDLQDGCHTTVDIIHHDGKHVAIRTGIGAEVGVPVNRLRKLIVIDNGRRC